MNVKRLAFAFSAVLLLVLSLWFITDHQEENRAVEIDTTFKASMDDMMAEDLTMTITMFLHQLEETLISWDSLNLSDEQQKEEMINELEDHKHIYGFMKKVKGNETVEAGEVSFDDFSMLKHKKDNEIKVSDPFIKQGTKRILIGREEKNEAFLAELNLAFIEDFIKDFAVLTDSNGQFFMGNGDMDVAFSDEEAELPFAKKEIPELGWSLYVQSEEVSVEEEHVKHGEVIVDLVPETNAEEWASEKNVLIVDQLDSKIVIRDPKRKPDELIELWQEDPSVIQMEPNYTYSKQVRQNPVEKENVFKTYRKIPMPNDEFYKEYQWNLSQVFAEDAWPFSIGEESIPIAIIDSGIDPEHIDLTGKIIEGYNAFEGNEDYHDEHGHGTHVAGIAGAITNNMDGIAGVSWNNPLLAVKVLDHNAEGNSFSIAKGIIWAVDHGAKVINLSLGDSHNSEIMHDAILYAYKNDVVLIAASGNDNVEEPMYPAAYSEVLAVSAVTPHGEKAFFSNYGDYIDVTAPGEHIPSTFPGDQYVIMSGTSMASPHVAGMAGLIRSINPELTNEEVYQLIRETSEDLGDKGYDPYYGHGLINIKKAMEAAS